MTPEVVIRAVQPKLGLNVSGPHWRSTTCPGKLTWCLWVCLFQGWGITIMTSVTVGALECWICRVMLILLEEAKNLASWSLRATYRPHRQGHRKWRHAPTKSAATAVLPRFNL